MERHGAVVAGTDGDTVIVQHLGGVMGVNAVDREGDHPAPPLGLRSVDGDTGHLAQSIEGIADQLALMLVDGRNADLLQEVDRGTGRSGNVDQLRTLMDATRLAGVFGRTLDYDGGTYGIAMLSRLEFLYDNTFALPVTPVQARAGGSHEPRGALLAVAATRAGRLYAMTTHLDASREEAYRLQEADQVIALAKSRVSDDTPLMLGGDFNSEPDSAVQQRLRAAGLRDAWTECGHGGGFTYPADTPVKRIDYLFLTASLHCTDARVIETQASDHRPLLVTVTKAVGSRQ